MIEKPVFSSRFHVEIVDREGVFLLSDRGHFVLNGEVCRRLAPLLDGRRSADDLVDEVDGNISPAEVYYALAVLEQKGYIVDVSAAIPPDREALWSACGLDARVAEARLEQTTASIVTFGSVAVDPAASSLAALGVRVEKGGDFAVVFTDDYLQDDLREFNAAAVASGQPWLLIKPTGTIVWIGPIFRPGKTACWECLAQRLRVNREVESYLQHRQHLAAPPAVSVTVLPAIAHTAFHLSAIEVARAIATGDVNAPDASLTTLDVVSLQTQKHRVVRRPQCHVCGAAEYRAEWAPARVTLQSQKKQFTADGGHRTTSPARTFAQYEHHISSITGVVSSLTPMAADDDSVTHVYAAAHNPATSHETLAFLREGLRNRTGGKGMTDPQARASALCEALERYSGNFQGDEPRRSATYHQLGARAVHPNACMLFSDEQYRRRQEWNGRRSRYNHVPDPLDEDVAIEWTPVWSLTAREFSYLPTSYCFYRYRMPSQARYCWADSNGNAAGNTIEEAILQGFMELVERDAVALWWYNRIRRPAVDLNSFDEPYLQQLSRHYRTHNREVWALDLTTDLHVPAFAACSRRTDRPDENIMFGFGAHFDPRIAIARAFGEMNQWAARSARFDANDDRERLEPELLDWWNTATLANQAHLSPADTAPRKCADFETAWSDDLRDDILQCQQIVERCGMEMLVLDQTRPDIGIPVVKVFVPGLRHFWARFAPGRLYEVPVSLGWLEQPLSEEQLNPVPIFL